MPRSLLRALALLALAFTLAACTDRSSSSDHRPDPDFELRIYASTGQNGSDMARVVQRLLAGPMVEGSAEQAFFGRVQTLPNGDLAILAPDDVHDDLERLFAEAGKNLPEPAAAELQFWLIEASPSDRVIVSQRLAALEDALLDVAEQTGPMAFELVEQVRQRSDIDQQRTMIRGSTLYADTSQSLVGDDRLRLDLNLRAADGGPSTSSNVTLRDGETVLLAQTGRPDSESLYIFVVRVDLL